MNFGFGRYESNTSRGYIYLIFPHILTTAKTSTVGRPKHAMNKEFVRSWVDEMIFDQLDGRLSILPNYNYGIKWAGPFAEMNLERPWNKDEKKAKREFFKFAEYYPGRATGMKQTGIINKR